MLLADLLEDAADWSAFRLIVFVNAFVVNDQLRAAIERRCRAGCSDDVLNAALSGLSSLSDILGVIRGSGRNQQS